MANLDKVRIKSFPIKLDKERVLRYDMNAFAALEDHYGSIEGAMSALQKGSVKGLLTLLWAGLIHEDENITIKQVGAMIDFDDVKNLGEVIGKAMSSSMPGDKEEKTEGAEPKNSTRQSSRKKASS